MSRTFLGGILLSSLTLGACSAELSTKRAALSACEAAVEKAAAVLPDGLVSNVTGIEAGQSGTAVSCAVKAEKAHLMVDATVTCSGNAEALLQCTAIDAVQTMDGQLLYP